MKLYSRRISSIQSQDYDENGKVINICFLNFPFISNESNQPYFHFKEDKEVDSKLKKTRVVTKEELKTNLEDYLRGWGLDDTLTEKEALEMLTEYHRTHMDDEEEGRE